MQDLIAHPQVLWVRMDQCDAGLTTWNAAGGTSPARKTTGGSPTPGGLPAGSLGFNVPTVTGPDGLNGMSMNHCWAAVQPPQHIILRSL